MGYYNFGFLRQIFYILKKSKRLRIFIITLIILFIFYKSCFAAATGTYDVEAEIVNQQSILQDTFFSFCAMNYYRNSDHWVNTLQPLIYDIFHNELYYYITIDNLETRVDYHIYTYHPNRRDDNNFRDYKSLFDNVTYSILQNKFLPEHYTHYRIRYDQNTDTATLSTVTSDSSLWIPHCVTYYQSQYAEQFIAMSLGEITTTTDSLLNSINSSITSLNTVDNNILTLLNNFSSILNSIQQNTSSDYSQQISQISNKIDDILSDNQEIISQNDEMIQQQEEINNNLEQVSSNIEDVNDTLTDDTVESSASDLPSTDVQDPSEAGIANIFQSIYNAFCTGEAQDIVFPIPFTDKNITLSPYYVRDMLNNNGAGWVYALIQAFWGYLIGRFVVSDISKKIDKVKSGNIENIENSNIKEEML